MMNTSTALNTDLLSTYTTESIDNMNLLQRGVKRAADIFFSLLGLVCLSPIFLVIYIIQKCTSEGPAIFSQERIGYKGKPFNIYKFRSMTVDAEKDGPALYQHEKDDRMTKAGKFLREHHLDELPQLWNIFRGNMSVIGPRPALWNQDYLTAERDKYGANDVKPGLTGLAQISGRDELEIEEKAKLDGVYAKALKSSSVSGFLMDMKMFFGSVGATLKSKGIVEGGTGTIAKEFEKANSISSIDDDKDCKAEV